MEDWLFGSQILSPDERLRLTVPTKHLDPLRKLAGVGADDPLELVLTITVRETLGVFPKPVFRRIMNDLMSKPPRDLDAEELRLTFLNYMDVQSLDKAGRIRIPQIHAERLGLSGDLAVMGSGEYLEVTTKAKWEELLSRRLPMMKVMNARVAGATEPASV